MSGKVIAIEAGHGLKTAGKRCAKVLDMNETREWALNDRVARQVMKVLAEYDCTLVRVDDPTGATDVALKTRTDKVNNSKADIFVSIHHNANGTSEAVNGKWSGGGLMVYRHPNRTDSAKLQETVYNHMITAGAWKGNRSSPLSTSNFHVCREAKCPTILVECGFMDSNKETPMILKPEMSIVYGNGIANAIISHCKLAKKQPALTPKPTDDNRIPDGTIVNFTGNTHYTSANNGNGFSTRPGKVKITDYKAGAEHPYHVTTVDNKVTNAYGWVNEKDINGTAPSPGAITRGSVIMISPPVRCNTNSFGTGTNGKTISGKRTVDLNVYTDRKYGVHVAEGWIPWTNVKRA